MLYIISDSAYKRHLTGPNHPEQPARIKVIVDALEAAGLKTSKNSIKPRMGNEEDVLLCHTPSYFATVQHEVRNLYPNNLALLSTGDVVISPNSLEVAMLAIGGALEGVDLVMNTPDSKAFCIIRPPGHHASSNQGMGFCLFNNVAIAARYAQKKYGINNVLIADWDVHHGNGTQEIFYHDPSVFYFSTHEAGLYPGTGQEWETGGGNGIYTTLNCAISPGPLSRIEVIKAFDEKLRGKMKNFKPELILISAGFDAHQNDPLGHFNLLDEDFGTLTQILVEIANEFSQGRIISLLEGGYNLDALASASCSHARFLM